MKLTLKNRLLNYILKQSGPVASGTLQRLVAEKTKYTPQNVGRRLRELEVEGLISVEYRANHAWYSKPTAKRSFERNKLDPETLLRLSDDWFKNIKV